MRQKWGNNLFFTDAIINKTMYIQTRLIVNDRNLDIEKKNLF
jgi:hypothetical protein